MPMTLSGLCPPCSWPALLRACILALPLSAAVKVSTGPAHWKSGHQGSLAEMGLRGGRVDGVENMDKGEWQVTILPEATACSCCHGILLVSQSATFTQGSLKSPGGSGGSHLKELRQSWERRADLYHRQHLSGIQKKKMNTGRIWPCCIVLRREGGREGRRMEGG